MNAPQTLLSIAGASLPQADWQHAALLLIDHQEEYRQGSAALSGLNAAITECTMLQQQARAATAPVLHIVHHGRPGGSLFDPQGPGVAILPELQPQAGEAHIIKHLPNAFAGTDLHAQLQATGRQQLVIAGFATHMCVSSTTRAALDLGYACTVIAGACATRDLPNPLGGIVSAAEVQRASLAALADRFAIVLASAQQLA